MTIVHGSIVRDADRSSVARLDGRDSHRCCLHLFAILEHRVLEREDVSNVSECVLILQSEFLVSERHEVHVAIHIFHLSEFRSPLTSRSDDAIAHEVSLETFVAIIEFGVIIARGVVVQTRHRISEWLMILDATSVIDALVYPVPDASADDRLAILYDVPVFLQVAHSLSHGVCVFADEVWFVMETFGKALHHLYLRIHVATKVRVAFAVLIAFIVHQSITTRQESLHAVVGGLEVDTTTALIAQRPEDDARVIAVTQHHALSAVHICGFPCGVIREALIIVALHVSLVHAVESIVVKHGIHLRLARIVACADGVDISLLHQDHVTQHGRHVDGMAIERMDVLSVDTLAEYALAIDQHLPVGIDAHVTETVFGGEYHLLAVVALLLDDDSVEIRILGAPWMQTRELAHVDADVLGLGALVHVDSGRLSSHSLALAIEERHLYLLGRLLGRGIVEGEVDSHSATGVAIVESGCDVVVRDECRRCGHEIHVAVYTSEVPHVLTLEIGSVTPAIDTHGEIVVASAQIRSGIKLSVGVGTL